MNDRFLSGSGENKVVTPKPKGSKSIRFKEDVTKCLIADCGIPLRKAEVAVIDLRGKVSEGYHGRLTPLDTAKMMLPYIEKIYNHSSK